MENVKYDLILRGGHVIDPASKCSEVMDVAISGGKIAAKGKDLSACPAKKVLHRSLAMVKQSPTEISSALP